MEVHQFHKAFEFRVLAGLDLTIDSTNLQAAVASPGADMDVILEARVPQFEALSADPVDYTVMITLFSTTVAPSPHPSEHTKCHQFT